MHSLMRRVVPLLLLCAGARPLGALRAGIGLMAPGRPGALRAPAPARMALELPSIPGGFGWGGSKEQTVMYEAGLPVDFVMEKVSFTRRRVSGGVLVRATPEQIWSVLTAYERMPDVIPNILSNVVTRDAASGRVTIQQESQLSRRLNLVTSMTLEAVEVQQARALELRRVTGHGFLEFEGRYTLTPRGGSTYLAYEVELVPCPIFPLPLVERKIRKEVPKMLAAVALEAIATPAAAPAAAASRR